MSGLVSIRQAVEAKAESMTLAHGDWPCRKGCDDCCRSLASIPLVSSVEWAEIRRAVDQLPEEIAEAVRGRIRASAAGVRPFTCPLLDDESGACLVYSARPVECRTYGFFVERDRVLGCHRIEALARDGSSVIWGNHERVAAELGELGPAAPLYAWLGASAATAQELGSVSTLNPSERALGPSGISGSLPTESVPR